MALRTCRKNTSLLLTLTQAEATMVTLRILVYPKRAKTNIFRLIRHENVPVIEELFTATMPLIATH